MLNLHQYCFVILTVCHLAFEGGALLTIIRLIYFLQLLRISLVCRTDRQTVYCNNTGIPEEEVEYVFPTYFNKINTSLAD